ncbi:MAG: type II toxin-antitoxin system HicA family toxin [Xanthomonadales bacterium]|nr:type II toxin-antitoxin system HicA family toxin [Xanthomonadales bacterium]
MTVLGFSRVFSQKYTTIPNHPGDMPEGTLRAILKQAGATVNAFLQA